MQTFFKSAKILCIPLLQIRKLCQSVNRKSANFYNYSAYCKSTNCKSVNFNKIVHNSVLKVFLYTMIFFILYICKEKSMYLWTCWSFKSAKKWQSWVANRKFTNYEYANQKKIGSANRKYAKCHIFGTPANLRICDLRKLFADRPPLLAL